jgi:catechol 2,3-dioxygenase-like lactoylglutathione lyase family enzyme
VGGVRDGGRVSGGLGRPPEIRLSAFEATGLVTMSLEQQPMAVEKLTIVTLVVNDQEAAREWYEEKLGFEVRADAPFEMEGKTGRWLTVAPTGNSEIEIALVSPDPDLYDMETLEELGAMHGTTTMWTFTTQDIDAAMAELEANGVDVDGETTDMEWGRFLMFRDLDGNALQLHEPAEMPE